MPPSAGRLPESLVERVLDRLGLGARPAANLAGLHTIYASWCTHVPFDNVRKVVALRTGAPGPLPGGDAVDFFTHWLAHGAGGTCWPSSNALFVLVDALGFQARRVAGSMGDTGRRNHGSVKVRLEGRDWLVDSSMLTNAPLPLDGIHPHADPVVPVEIEPASRGEEGTHVLWFDNPATPAPWLPCRLLDDPVAHDFYLERYERSRTQSPFNGMVVVRRSGHGLVRVLRGPKYSRRTPGAFDLEELGPDEVVRRLVDDLGFSEALIAAWRACGGLEASFAPPPAAPDLPAETRLPPSRRGQPGSVADVTHPAP